MVSLIRLHRWRGVTAGLYAALAGAAMLGSFLLRFDLAIPHQVLPLLYAGMLIAVPVKLTVFLVLGLTRGSWRYPGTADLVRLAMGNAAASAAFTIVTALLVGRSFPRSIYLLDLLLCFLLIAGAHFAARLYRESLARARNSRATTRILIYGAGAAGMTLVREIGANPSLGRRAVGFLDDDSDKTGARILGVRVLGRGRDAAAIVERLARRGCRIDEIVIAMPSATSRQMQEALANCRATRVPCKTIPGLGELLQSKVLMSQIREVSMEDLIGRDPVEIEEERIEDSIRNRCVLVTGAAGSIGSELCRQVASFQPRRLVAFDQAESELFKIDLELRRRYPSLDVVAEIADIRDEWRVRAIFDTHSPDIVFHAAAYKHVHLMEAHPLEAIRNNVMGTRNLVKTAYRKAVPSFVMISSDKAVNPTSIMGATKRLSELMLSAMPAGRTKFVSVRFGNVIGSNGSAIPIFQAQIAAGGPVTVTHPDMRRYFMTIREAVQLVLLASTMGSGSETFVLDMGEPVRIVELANNLIRLAGKSPGEDIEIRFVGMRPGEKLFEELTDGENVLPTQHKKIRVLQGQKADRRTIEEGLDALEHCLEQRDVGATLRMLKRLMPEYTPDPIWREAFEPARAAAGRA